jgi:hypothetical protein
MAHFAELDQNNVVKRVIVVSDRDTSDENGIEDEQIGINFCKMLFGQNTNWRQTSYNSNIRKRYAGKGMIYNADLDAFIAPQPFPSWTLNSETADWDAPTPRPELTEEEIASRSYYIWDEDAYNEVGEGWTLFTPELPLILESGEESVGIAST